jgi:hypothetical protein
MSPATNRPKTPGKLPPKPSRTINNKTKGAHELPDDWMPEPFAHGSESQRIIDGWPPGEAARQSEAFQAHHGAKGSKFKDWQKAWSTWVLNSGKFGNGKAIRTSGGGGNRRSALAIAIDEGLEWLDGGGAQAQVS